MPTQQEYIQMIQQMADPNRQPGRPPANILSVLAANQGIKPFTTGQHSTRPEIVPMVQGPDRTDGFDYTTGQGGGARNPGPLTGWSRTPGGGHMDMDRPMKYLNYARGQEGWNPEWDNYNKILYDYLKGNRKDVTEPMVYSGGRDGSQPSPSGPTHIPQADWAAIGEFAKGLKPMSGDEWIRPTPWRTPVPRPPWLEPIKRPPIEARYIKYLQGLKGWNPEWNRYEDILQAYLKDPSLDVRIGLDTPGGGPGWVEGIPQDIWSDIGEWYERGIKQGKMDGGGPGIMPKGAWQRWDMAFPPGRTPWLDPTRPKIEENVYGLGGRPSPGQEVAPPWLQKYMDQQEGQIRQQGVLQDLANKNAMRRQVLARMMNRPRGMSSLMR